MNFMTTLEIQLRTFAHVERRTGDIDASNERAGAGASYFSSSRERARARVDVDRVVERQRSGAVIASQLRRI